MEKSISRLIGKLGNFPDGKLHGGFGSIKGGMAIRNHHSVNTSQKGCSNSGASCSGTNSGPCTNSNDCTKTSNGGGCTNSIPSTCPQK